MRFTLQLSREAVYTHSTCLHTESLTLITFWYQSAIVTGIQNENDQDLIIFPQSVCLCVLSNICKLWHGNRRSLLCNPLEDKLSAEDFWIICYFERSTIRCFSKPCIGKCTQNKDLLSENSDDTTMRTLLPQDFVKTLFTSIKTWKSIGAEMVLLVLTLSQDFGRVHHCHASTWPKLSQDLSYLTGYKIKKDDNLHVPYFLPYTCMPFWYALLSFWTCIIPYQSMGKKEINKFPLQKITISTCNIYDSPAAHWGRPLPMEWVYWQKCM